MNLLSEAVPLSEFIRFYEFLGFRKNSLSVPCALSEFMKFI